MDYHEPLIVFFGIGNIAQRTRDLLGDYMRRRDRPLTQDQHNYVTSTLTHLDHVREGFQITLRTRTVRDFSELRDMIQQTLVRWDWLKDYELELQSDDAIHKPLLQTLAFAHSYVTLGVLPQMPAKHVTFPGDPPTYADIPVPHTPGQLLTRIDELQNVLSQATVQPNKDTDPGSLRRTYGFFETSAWLISRHLGLFLKD